MFQLTSHLGTITFGRQSGVSWRLLLLAGITHPLSSGSHFSSISINEKWEGKDQTVFGRSSQLVDRGVTPPSTVSQ